MLLTIDMILSPGNVAGETGVCGRRHHQGLEFVRQLPWQQRWTSSPGTGWEAHEAAGTSVENMDETMPGISVAIEVEDEETTEVRVKRSL
jgi:hypothetical protein